VQTRVKCLLVDDLEENLIALSALLRRDDVELLTARSAAEALELLLAHDVALALIDVQMPEIDGFELAELIRGSERTRQVPLIFVTAGAHDQRRVFKGYESGAVDFLYKPIDAHVLKSKADVFFQLHRQKEQLARELTARTEALRLTEMFTAVLGHDLRNPLNAMLVSATVIQRASSDETVCTSAARIVSSGRRMNQMVDDLLDFARARLAGGIALQRQETDLVSVTSSVIGEHQAVRPERPIEMRTAGDLVGYWDGSRLAQAISNLIGNALQHGESGSGVQVHLVGTGSEVVEVLVINRGTIPPEVLPYVFEPFHGDHKASGRGAGLGLGLYISQQIVRAHRGQLDVALEPDSCVVFRASLPRRSSEIIDLSTRATTSR
jgi:two-component system sensor histidine kinase/response regulator